MLEQAACTADDFAKAEVSRVVEAKRRVVHYIGHQAACCVELQIASANGCHAAVSVDTAQIHITCALLDQVGRGARNNTRQQTAASGIEGQCTTRCQADVVSAVDVCAAQQHITGQCIGGANGTAQRDVAAIDRDGAIDCVA